MTRALDDGSAAQRFLEVFAKLYLATASDEFLRRVQGCFTVADEAPAALPGDLVLERT